MPKFITSDWHLGEDRMTIMGRPYKTGDECVEDMIAKHNSVVKPDDDVVVVGDVCYQKHPETLPLVAKFNGRKILLRGNHDRVFSDADLKPYFNEIVPEGEQYEIAINAELTVKAVHYPTRGSARFFSLVGHIHTAWKYQLNMMNIGVDANHFYPVSLDTVPFHMKAIAEFYDQDVWVAYNPINAQWCGLRGKAGTYFDAQAGGKA